MPFVHFGKVGNIIIAYHSGAFLHAIALSQSVIGLTHSHIHQELLDGDAGLFLEKST